jgi:hypothetical protein
MARSAPGVCHGPILCESIMACFAARHEIDRLPSQRYIVCACILIHRENIKWNSAFSI